ncbi:hypothetical protein HZ326_26726 [Fusarium oxysporum f. sp. albedinis]|nr:hypothetical protein HZ326_26726 [Fusarium oxysporum f. sp. albedinis]
MAAGDIPLSVDFQDPCQKHRMLSPGVYTLCSDGIRMSIRKVGFCANWRIALAGCTQISQPSRADRLV